MINPISWFEIPVADMDRAKKFYDEVFQIDIPVQDLGNFVMGWFPSNLDQYGSGGALVKAESYVPSYHGTTVYFFTDEINDVLPRIACSGGKVINPKTSIGEHGFVAHFEDSEGNRIALHQRR